MRTWHQYWKYRDLHSQSVRPNKLSFQLFLRFNAWSSVLLASETLHFYRKSGGAYLETCTIWRIRFKWTCLVNSMTMVNCKPQFGKQLMTNGIIKLLLISHSRISIYCASNLRPLVKCSSKIRIVLSATNDFLRTLRRSV